MTFVYEISQHLSELGYLPYPAADTHSRYRSRPILARELEEATYDSDGIHVGSIVEVAGKRQLPHPPASICYRQIALKCNATRGGVQGSG